MMLCWVRHGQVEKAVKEQERLAYIDPEKSLEEKQKGNDAFTKGLYHRGRRHSIRHSRLLGFVVIFAQALELTAKFSLHMCSQSLCLRLSLRLLL